MRFEPIQPPRKYRVGLRQQIEIKDCGRMHLQEDEQITFMTPGGQEYDVAAKSWGFYATPSVNGRLKQQGFRSALVRNSDGRHYVMLVRNDRMQSFQDYLNEEKQVVVEWLDERA